MEKNSSIYRDIATRTNGDVYIGVVGPVRCGKSTFIQNFMKNFVLENISNKHDKQRATDELPQAGDGYRRLRSPAGAERAGNAGMRRGRQAFFSGADLLFAGACGPE